MASVPTTQKALEVVQFGDPLKGTLKLNKEAPVPKPGDGQVLVEMKYACLNPADVFTVQGIYPGVKNVTEKKPGFVAGLEGSGKVVATGSGCSLKAGTRVVPLLGERAGSWQQYLVVSEKQCIPVPDDVDDATAAQLFVNPLTVVGMLDEIQQKAPVKDNPWIVQTAANSTLGRMFIQLARKRGLKTINVIRTSATKQELVQLGADEVVVVSEESELSKKILQLTGGKGAAAVVDAVGGEIGTACCSSLAKGGLFQGYGLQSGQPIQVSNSDLIFKDIVIRGFWLAIWFPKQPSSVVQEVFDMLRKKELVPHIQKIFALEDYLEAFKAQFSPDRRGKILFKLT
ncbi:Trans-2-enoyl-CoA reductase, mitochondrial [Galdieria sulphuraria]|uniref:Oxidoreductase, zinc-binding dehydrogenase family protein n=1 Tax=Galdieria sulphuraria TaxID=130081 RepID=M2W5D3_GALSU|nr:oxidoreductase, zinc-binding dehydrogenase family protein [Galdieria sulphuraria]EME30986.1 oxidoreductase, zinc-binding dehydrogenase family protein [Galdieria sulphuraria]GJD10943.1 Trans-2-enoyl-CoA reductase, mitochondrial [Galdieria sulphuraria]|eukprot:XP_005707506.1 oxidoreductase, zinc-binding dehydrogenase family protein [Galdieria sulphuraria]